MRDVRVIERVGRQAVEGAVALDSSGRGLALRHGIAIVNAPGLIDAAYRGELKVVLLNTDDNAMGKARAYAGMYQELTREAAMRTIRFWRARKAMQAA